LRAHDNIHLKRNPYFYDNKNVWFDEVFYYPTEDTEAALRRFRAGELDINSG
jgi:oligopeptide transport system substrate-binding protein